MTKIENSGFCVWEGEVHFFSDKLLDVWTNKHQYLIGTTWVPQEKIELIPEVFIPKQTKISNLLKMCTVVLVLVCTGLTLNYACSSVVEFNKIHNKRI